MPKIKHIINGDVFTVSDTPVFRAGIWECGDQRFTDEAGDQYEVIESAGATVSRVKFKMLWLIDELIAIDDLAVADRRVKKFMDILDDPQTIEVNMSLASVQTGIGYIISQLPASILPADQRASRFAEILSGQFK